MEARDLLNNSVAALPNVTTQCYPNWSVGASSGLDGLSPYCEAQLEAVILDMGLVFDRLQLARVVITWVCFLLSFAGNLVVLACVTMWRDTAHMTYCQLIITNLSAANLAFTFFVLPMDGVWNVTMMWYGGDVACRILNMGKQFAIYISSVVVVVMTVDKVICLLHTTSPNGTKPFVKRILAAAWIYSIVNSVPASLIFSVEKISVHAEGCPNMSFPQCADYCLLDKRAKTYYFLYTMFMSFFLPVMIIVACYGLITVALARMTKDARESDQWKRSSLTRKRVHQVRRSWQVVTGLLTASFFISWGPYYLTGLVYFFNESVMSQTTRTVLYMSSYFYPCIQPFITLVQMKEVRDTMRANTIQRVTSIFSHDKPPASPRDFPENDERGRFL